MTFKLAHLSDPHIGPLPAPGWRELMGKRLTGWWNWHKHRHDIHNMDVLARILDDVVACHPDHVALSGDLVNIGLDAEFAQARAAVARLGAGGAVSIVPGNHDAYVADSLRFMTGHFGDHMRGDAGAAEFPYLRIRGDIALIGVSSAIPTLPFLASGAVGEAQLQRLGAMLDATRDKVRVVMIHHPPHFAGARRFRRLRDAPAMEAVLARHGAELVLHGHNHRRSLARLAGPDGATIPVVGVASCSAVPGDAAHRAAWHLFQIAREDGRLSITLDVRGMEAPDAPVTLLDRQDIT